MYGSSFVIETDHKPLEKIQCKDLSKIPQRLQRLKLRLQSYDKTVRYTPGKEMFFPDMLSRLGSVEGTEVDLDKTMHMLIFSDDRKRELQSETSKDTELISPAKFVNEGWTDTGRVFLKT